MFEDFFIFFCLVREALVSRYAIVTALGLSPSDAVHIFVKLTKWPRPSAPPF